MNAKALRSRAHRLLRDRLGLDVIRVAPAPKALPDSAPVHAQSPKLEPDPVFDRLYAAGAQRTDTEAPGKHRRHDRRYNLVQLLRATEGVEGFVGECGVFKGLSAYLLCEYLRMEDPSFAGRGVHLFDSFEGLSEPNAEDRVAAGVDVAKPDTFGGSQGEFSAPLEQVRHTLADFPEVGYHAGWIPDCFVSAPDGPWRLVSVDVDLYQPTRDALEFFYPRLAPGGVLVCDDYGFRAWPGARRAVEEMSEALKAPTFRVSTGQAVLFAPARR